MLTLVIKGSVKVGAFFKVLLGVTLRIAFGRTGHSVRTGGQGNAGRNGGSGDNGKEIEVHGEFLGNGRGDLARWGMGQTYSRERRA